uniref:Cap1 n=1 Tax=Arundo donax TaxID=35708 RepID=A0A0A9CTR3_ARUDO
MYQMGPRTVHSFLQEDPFSRPEPLKPPQSAFQWPHTVVKNALHWHHCTQLQPLRLSQGSYPCSPQANPEFSHLGDRMSCRPP